MNQHDDTHKQGGWRIQQHPPLALVWDQSLNNSITSEHSFYYWNDSPFSKWLVQNINNDSESNRNSSNHYVCGLSYPVLFGLIRLLTQQIRQSIESHLSKKRPEWLLEEEEEEIKEGRSKNQEINNNTPNVKSLVAAVAIPEGIYLPLALASVHALNRPFAINSLSSNELHHHLKEKLISLVILPLEPTEGIDRLRHQILDAQLFVVFTASPKDGHRLQEAIAMQKGPQEHQGPGDGDDSDWLMLDMVSLVREAVKSEQLESIIAENNQFLYEKQHDVGGARFRSLLLGQKEVKHVDTTEEEEDLPRMSHIVYTSGTTGLPKGCISSIASLDHYLAAKNAVHGITSSSTVLLASALSFDPCLSDVLATLRCGARLALAPRQSLKDRLYRTLQRLHVSHVLCTPTLWSSILVEETEIDVATSSMTTTTTITTAPSNNLPHLLVVALGGEPISPRIRQSWARRRPPADHAVDVGRQQLRLLATYGVTEACVYQTAGEVFQHEPQKQQASESTTMPGQNVGQPFAGLGIRICREQKEKATITNGKDGDVKTMTDVTDLVDLDPTLEYPHNVGEVVLYGKQLDALSLYLNRPELSKQKFIRQKDPIAGEVQYYYRTGDRGYLHKTSRDLYLLGRISGESGMVKINGVRVELAEIEHALIDSDYDDHGAVVVVDSMVVAQKAVDVGDFSYDHDMTAAVQKLFAYVVLSRECRHQMLSMPSFSPSSSAEMIPSHGALCTGPLLVLLRERCRRKCRVVPNAFVAIPRIPLSPTGKRDRKGAPAVSDAVSMDSLAAPGCSLSEVAKKTLLKDYGTRGALLAEQIVDCLNLHVSQKSLLTTTATFEMLGGDSLAATRVVRALYSHFHGVPNTRLLGGAHGILEDDRFSVLHLIRAPTLGSYVDFLDETTSGALLRSEEKDIASSTHQLTEPKINENTFEMDLSGVDDFDEACHLLNDALLEAVMRGHTLVAMALLEVGANPNAGVADSRNFRLSKTSSRIERRQVFFSTSLHHACLQGNPVLVQALVRKGAKTTSPDASGVFPLHLAAGGTTRSDDLNIAKLRWECVRVLLDEAKVPLPMKDGNKQTILHAAARAGQDYVLLRALERWKVFLGERNEKIADSMNWRDHWSRTPVHWAILNGHLSTLRILLEAGCKANPVVPNKSKATSAALESPMDLCSRLYASTEMGEAMANLLDEFTT